ncbi:MAG: class I SAM-dependent methyltransferase [Gemmatimonadota bacterium]
MSRSLSVRVARLPVIGRLLLLPYRFARGWSIASRPLRQFFRALAVSREYTNYTYALEERNVRYLTAFIAAVAGCSRSLAERYVDELEQDGELRAHIRNGIRSSPDGRFADWQVAYGRRAGWYAFVRMRRPRVVVETGVDKGLGACVLTAALRRNAAEGCPGRYYGTDMNRAKGYLLSGEYAGFGELLIGDSVTTLRSFEQEIDLFVNDSDHSADYERSEYEAIAAKLSPHALVLTDNAEVTDELLQFADRTGRRFLYFREEPKDHWFPGGGIGAAWSEGVTDDG